MGAGYLWAVLLGCSGAWVPGLGALAGTGQQDQRIQARPGPELHGKRLAGGCWGLCCCCCCCWRVMLGIAVKSSVSPCCCCWTWLSATAVSSAGPCCCCWVGKRTVILTLPLGAGLAEEAVQGWREPSESSLGRMVCEQLVGGGLDGSGQCMPQLMAPLILLVRAGMLGAAGSLGWGLLAFRTCSRCAAWLRHELGLCWTSSIGASISVTLVS